MKSKDAAIYQEPDAVLGKERDFINLRRPENKKVNDDLVGLAFSGGGIRSATFGLGVLEGLKRCGLLPQIDYLSTVSGGGYIGAWLSANCQRAAAKPTSENWLYASDEQWDDSVTHLRRYSNYLSPDLGFFSADTWSMLTIWLRNTILVQFTVILAIAVALLAPRPLFFAFDWWPAAGLWRWTTILLFIFGVVGIAGNLEQRCIPLPFRSWWKGLLAAAGCGGIAGGIAYAFDFHPFKEGKVEHPVVAIIVASLLVFAAFWLQPLTVFIANKCRKEQRKAVNYTQFAVQYGVVLPMMAVALLVAAILWEQAKGDLAQIQSFGALFTGAWRYWPFPLTVVFTSLLLLSLCSMQRWSAWVVFAPVAAVVTLHALLCAIVLLLQGWAQKGAEGARGELLAFIWTPSFVLYAFSLSIVMLIGMVGRDSSEGVREWWSRFGAWLAIYGAAWMIVCVAAIYGPIWVATLFYKASWPGLSVGAGWVGTTLGGLFAGGSNSTGGKGPKSTSAKALDLFAKIAPFVFIAGLLVTVATGLHYIITLNSGLDMNGPIPPELAWYLLWSANRWVTMFVLMGCAAALVLMAARVDINEFSLNAFYRNRLVRCYLGATRPPEERHPQNFTGFDDLDDLPLTKLISAVNPAKLGPFHIVNCALNLGGSSDLSVHTRHSAEFTLTPLCCGSNYVGHNMLGMKEPPMGYVSTSAYGEGGGPTLGQAISVSGAAASPNMGYHTSAVVAFLLTLFNVRLGWWFPNPEKSGVNSSSPWFSLRYLIMELFGVAGDKAKYLAISDGGHFENLAAYELIRRKCKVIIVSDAEADPDLQFEGLGTLIRMVKVDLDAIVTIDVSSIRPTADSTWSASRSAIGTIRYSDGTSGTLVYLKASMNGHEGTGILQYKSVHATFPHESTSNQFYREDQFESYRSLGNEVAAETFLPIAKSPHLATAASRLEELLSPAPPHVSRFTRNSTRLMELWSQMSRNDDLQFLEQELTSNWPADPPTGFRSSFYVCSQMIQLMENVYLELDLEKTWDYADHKGWRAMFETWSESATFRSVWDLTSDSYGLRFRDFCHRQLRLPM